MTKDIKSITHQIVKILFVFVELYTQTPEQDITVGL